MSLQEKFEQDSLEAQRITRKFFVVGLDFSLDGVSELNELANDIDVYMRGGATEENVQLLVRTWGAYLGETVRRSGIGEWKESSNDYGGLLEIGGHEMSPHEQVRRRLVEGDAFDLTLFVRQAQEHAGAE